MFGYKTIERTDEYDKNQLISNLISLHINKGFTIKENKDITISKIKPVETRYVECEKDNVSIKNYLIFTNKGVLSFMISTSIGVKSDVINEILDTVIVEDGIL